MILADTSIWIEFLRGKEPVAEAFSYLLERGEILTIEPVFAELMQGAIGKEERTDLETFFLALPKKNIKNLLFEAAKLSNEKKWRSKGIGLIDATLIFTAIKETTFLWTLDKKLEKEVPVPLRYAFVL